MARHRQGGCSKMWYDEEPIIGCENTDFPDRLRKLREKQRKKQQTVSELAGLASDAVRRYERREACPSMDSLVKLADYLRFR